MKLGTWSPDEESVTISLVTYKQLLADSRKLAALQAAGVDNWDGYDMIEFDEDDEETTHHE